MFVFGHIGITLGIFFLLKRHQALSRIPADLSLVAFGAMLPDLIDKPLGEVLLSGSLANGRIYGHTLLFCLLTLLMALYIYRNNKDTRPLIVPAATFLHLMEDRMWNTPQTLFWPLLGWQFPDGYHSAGILDYFLSIFSNAYTPAISYVFISELLGLSILIVAGVIRKKGRMKEHTKT